MSRIIFALAIAAATAGCGSINVWPLGGGEAKERSRAPANAVEYQCPGGKRFHVRWLDGGNAAWLILPDREVRLDKTAGTETRYGNGVTSLDIDGGTATLSDRSLKLGGCKTASAG